jgi:hypothetical protein
MKLFSTLVLGLIFVSFGAFGANNTKGSNSIFIHSNNQLDDSLKLKQVASSFIPKQLNLTNSILENGELNKFLATANKEVISSHADFDLFITTILLKQYQFHLTKFHQGFDLYSMRMGNAGFVVSSFVQLAKLPDTTKGINSSFIMEYVAASEKLKAEPSIMELVNAINAIPK